MRRQISLSLCVICWLAGFYQFTFGQQPELITQTGHNTVSGHITQIAFSPDGTTLASASFDKSVRLWDVATGTELRAWFHSEQCWSVAFNATGDLLAVGSEREVKIWDVAGGKALFDFRTNESYVSVVAFSFDGKLLAIGGEKTIELWSLDSRKPLRKLEGHTKPIRELTFGGDDKYLTSTSSDWSEKVWDVASGAIVKTSDAYPGMASSPDSKTAAMAVDNEIRISNDEMFDIVRVTVPGPGGMRNFINTLEFSPDGKILASGELFGIIRLWNPVTGEELRTFTGRGFDFSSIAFSLDKSTVALGDSFGGIRLWDMKRGMLLPAIHESSLVLKMAFSPNGQTLATTSLDSTIKLWDVTRGKIRETFVGVGKRFLGDMPPDSVGNPNALSQRFVAGVSAIAFSPDGKFLIGGGRDGTVRMWEVGTLKPPKIFLLGDEPNSVALSPDGELLVGAGERVIKSWRISDGRVVTTLRRNCPLRLACVNEVVFSSDSKVIASSLNKNLIRVWNSQGGTVTKSWNLNTASTNNELRDRFPELYERLSKLYLINNSVVTKFETPSVADRLVFLESSTRKELATLIIYGKNDWLLTTPEHLFDGTPNAWKQLFWRFDDKTFDYGAVELYFNEFFYPTLFKDVLLGRSPKPPAGRELMKIDRRQPKVKFDYVNGPSAIKSRTATVVIEVADNIEKKKLVSHSETSGVMDLRLFRNGVLVKAWAGDVFDKSSGCEMIKLIPNAPRRIHCQAEVTITAGENHFTAYAFNSSNVKSNDDTITIKGAESLKRGGTLFVLAIGIGQYANAQYNLNYSIADAQAFGEEIRRRQEQVRQYVRVEVLTLLNEQAKKADILAALTRLAGSVQPEDGVIVFFSGHGTAQQDRFYLIPHDIGYMGPRTNLVYEDLQLILTHSISDEELESSFRGIDAGQLLLVIDACNSGQALDSEEKRRGPMNSKGLAQLAYEKGMFVLTASQSVELAFESEALKHSYLTYALVEEGLKSRVTDADGNSDGELWSREWFDYAEKRVPRMRDERTGNTTKRPAKSLELIEVDGPPKVQTPRVFYRREPDLQPWVVVRAKLN